MDYTIVQRVMEKIGTTNFITAAKWIRRQKVEQKMTLRMLAEALGIEGDIPSVVIAFHRIQFLLHHLSPEEQAEVARGELSFITAESIMGIRSTAEREITNLRQLKNRKALALVR